MMFEWRNTQADMWRHYLVTSCTSDLAQNLTEIFLSKERTITNFYASFGDYSIQIKMILTEHYRYMYIGINNSFDMQFKIF